MSEAAEIEQNPPERTIGSLRELPLHAADTVLWSTVATGMLGLATEDPTLLLAAGGFFPAVRLIRHEAKGRYETINPREHFAALIGRSMGGALVSALIRNPHIQEAANKIPGMLVDAAQNPDIQLAAIATGGALAVGAGIRSAIKREIPQKLYYGVGNALGSAAETAGNVRRSIARKAEAIGRYTPLTAEGRQFFRDAASRSASFAWWGGLELGARGLKLAVGIPKTALEGASQGLGWFQKQIDSMAIQPTKSRRTAAFQARIPQETP